MSCEQTLRLVLERLELLQLLFCMLKQVTITVLTQRETFGKLRILSLFPNSFNKFNKT